MNTQFYDKSFTVALKKETPFLVSTSTCAGMMALEPDFYSKRNPVRQTPMIYQQSSNFWWDWFPYVFATLIGTGLFELFHLLKWIHL